MTHTIILWRHLSVCIRHLLIFVHLIFSQRLIGWWLRCGWSRSRLTYLWVSGHGACLTSFLEACMCFCFSTWRTARPASGWWDSTRYKHTQSPVLMRAWDIFVVFVEYLCLQCFGQCHLLYFWSVYTIKNTLSYSYIANITLIFFKEYEYAQCILEYGFKGIVHAKIGGVITLSNRVKAVLFLCCVGDAARKCYSAIGCIWHPDWCIMG